MKKFMSSTSYPFLENILNILTQTKAACILDILSIVSGLDLRKSIIGKFQMLQPKKGRAQNDVED